MVIGNIDIYIYFKVSIVILKKEIELHIILMNTEDIHFYKKL